MAVAPLSHSARDYVRAFDLTCIDLCGDGRLGVSRNPTGADQAWWCPAKAAGAIVRAANANGRDVAAGAAPLPTRRAGHVAAQRNPPAARVGLFGRSECDRADRGARWAAVALKQPLIRELPRAQRGRTLVRTAFKVRFSPKATPGADASLGPSWAKYGSHFHSHHLADAL
jgi:hypothetical protein